jgi:hypothetical protein
MPYKEPKIEKLYYTIGEVAEMFERNLTLSNPIKIKRATVYLLLQMWKIFILFITWLRKKA